jgi:hypothetical protein
MRSHSMNPILRKKMTAGAIALGLVVTALSTAAPVSAASFDFAISGGSSHSVGDSVTLSPSGSLRAEGTCMFVVAISRSTYAEGDPVMPAYMAQMTENLHTDPDGTCPSWTFTLPNPNTLIATDTNPTRVQVSLSMNTEAGTIAQASHAYQIANSSATAAPTSNHPTLFFHVSDTKSVTGQTVTVTLIPVGYPSGWPEGNDADGLFYCLSYFTDLDPAAYGDPIRGDCSNPESDLSITFTQHSLGAHLQAWGNRGALGSVSSFTVGLVDPPEGFEPTPEPTVQPTPVVTPEPTVDPTPVVTPEPTVEPTPVVTPEPTADPSPVITPDPTAEPSPGITPAPTTEPSPSVDPALGLSVTLSIEFESVDSDLGIKQVLFRANVVGGAGSNIFDLTLPGTGSQPGTPNSELSAEIPCGALPALAYLTVTDGNGATADAEVAIGDCGLEASSPVAAPTRKPLPPTDTDQAAAGPSVGVPEGSIPRAIALGLGALVGFFTLMLLLTGFPAAMTRLGAQGRAEEKD